MKSSSQEADPVESLTWRRADRPSAVSALETAGRVCRATYERARVGGRALKAGLRARIDSDSLQVATVARVSTGGARIDGAIGVKRVARIAAH